MHANTLIQILRGTLRLVEESAHISDRSLALVRLRDAVTAVIADLAAAAERESEPGRE